jgi:hypothetical protein
MQRQGLLFLKNEARLIEQRIAYKKAHPGVLPES